jgi:hypothetical protein
MSTAAALGRLMRFSVQCLIIDGLNLSNVYSGTYTLRTLTIGALVEYLAGRAGMRFGMVGRLLILRIIS